MSLDLQERNVTLGHLPLELCYIIMQFISGRVVDSACDVHDDAQGNSIWKVCIELREGNIDLIAKILSKSLLVLVFDEFNLHAWLKSWKHFQRPYELVAFTLSRRRLSNHGYSPNPFVLKKFNTSRFDDSAVPDFRKSCIPSPLTGDEKVILDFGAEEYFYAFNVFVPPFDRPVEHYDAFELGSGTFLHHVKNLVIRFGDRYNYLQPWCDVVSPEWHQELPDAHGNLWTPRLGPDICSNGTVVDWILSFAWHHGYLQPVETIEIEGAVQPWVKEKWEEIFRRHREENGFVHEVDIGAITDLALEDEQPWMHYPPMCDCKHQCHRLSRGLPEKKAQSEMTGDDNWEIQVDQDGEHTWMDDSADDYSTIW